MTKPDDIPQDAWYKAELVVKKEFGRSTIPGYHGLRAKIARAIMAAKAEEREKCASVVERMGIPRVIANDRILMLPPNIAEAIRSRGEVD